MSPIYHLFKALNDDTVYGCWGLRICFCSWRHVFNNKIALSLWPWNLNIDARLAMLVSVSKYSTLNTLFLISITYTSSSSASFYRPLRLYTNTTIAILFNVSSCSLLSSFFLAFINLTNIFSILVGLPLYYVYHTALYSIRAHSLSESLLLGCYINTDFAYRKSA